jgi:hypothetical protein
MPPVAKFVMIQIKNDSTVLKQQLNHKVVLNNGNNFLVPEPVHEKTLT